jgi:actin-related protein
VHADQHNSSKSTTTKKRNISTNTTANQLSNKPAHQLSSTTTQQGIKKRCRYPADVQAQLAANTFITGGLCAIPGFVGRVSQEVIQRQPFGSAVKIWSPKDCR